MPGQRYLFRRRQRGVNPYRALLLLVLVLSGLFVLRGYGEGAIRPAFEPTPTPTRIANSFAFEGETHFTAGNLNAAIAAYKQALLQDSKNSQLYAELARIQTYSSSLMTTDQLAKERLTDALASADQAAKLAPDDSTVHAIRSFVLDWNASNKLASEEQRQAWLTEAEQSAVRALQLDNKNALALAYYGEVLVDEYKLTQADPYIRQALERDSNLMDVHRVYGYFQETMGDYAQAIRSYERAAEIAPNLTFLYISIGTIYRHLKQYDKSLTYFTIAVEKDIQLGIQDPIPYLAISKTYSQTGDFFIAGRNVKKALQFDPTSPDVYGQLGIIYFKSRNYEGAIPALRCAVRGCTAAESCTVRECDEKKDPAIEIPAMKLTGNTLVYYYTYGSVLAGMHRTGLDNCSLAMDVFREVRAGFSGDDVVMSIIQPSEQICASFGVQ